MKKVISIIIAMIMLTTSAFAASRTFEKTASDKLNIVVDGGLEAKDAVAGKEVAVCIKLVNNKELSSLKMKLEYDEKLSVVTSKNKRGEDIPKITFDIVDPEDSSVMRSSWSSNSKRSAITLFASAAFRQKRWTRRWIRSSAWKNPCIIATRRSIP